MTCPCTTTSLCAEHQQSFLDILADVPDRLATMMVSVAKQSVTGGQGGSVKNDDDRPLPVNIGASDARLALRAELIYVIIRVRRCLGEGRLFGGDVPAACAWLARLMPRMVQHPECGDWYTRIRAAYDRTTKAIDLPPERVRAGRCSCNAVLYTVAGRETVQCKPCGLRYNVADMQAAEIGKVRDYTDTAAVVLRVLAAAGIKIRLTRLTNWADRGQIDYETTDAGRLYTVGNVYDLYNRMEGTKA